MRWDRISILIDKLQDDLERDGYVKRIYSLSVGSQCPSSSYSYFHLDTKQNVAIRKQEGVVRTNCMDNLDRTNVVQAAIAKWTLANQLCELDIIQGGKTIDDFTALATDLRESKSKIASFGQSLIRPIVWADHADSISKAYAGSGALKSDFTRTGKRTRQGMLDDGIKSVLRYIRNNYFDGPRQVGAVHSSIRRMLKLFQDAFDLVTGQWIPRNNPANSLFLISDPRPLAIRAMPPITFFSLFMIAAGLTLPRTSGMQIHSRVPPAAVDVPLADYSLTYYFLLWFTLLFISMGFILAHGIDYVSWPKLLPPTDIVYFNGPGFRSAHHGKGLRSFPLKLINTSKWLNSGYRRPGMKVGVEELEMQRVDKKHVD
jgi:phosphatidylinositol 4-phosphatase